MSFASRSTLKQPCFLKRPLDHAGLIVKDMPGGHHVQRRSDFVCAGIDDVRIGMTGVVGHDQNAMALVQLIPHNFVTADVDRADADFVLSLAFSKRSQPLYQGRTQAGGPDLWRESHSITIQFFAPFQSTWFSFASASTNACVPSLACPCAATA